MNAAEINGVISIDSMLAQAEQAVQQAVQRMSAIRAERERIYTSVNLDPTKKYNINNKTGEVSAISTD